MKMFDFEYAASIKAESDAAEVRIATTPHPPNQKYPPGTRVWVAKDLGPLMWHFPAGCWATVLYTYAHAFGGTDVQTYALDLEGKGFCAWYYESQLSLTTG